MWVKKIVPAKICYMMTQSDLDLFFETPFLFALLASLSCDAFPPDSVFACCGARGSRWCSNPRNWPQSQCRVPDRSNVRQPWGWGIADCSDCQRTSLCCTIGVCLLYLMYLMLTQNSLYMKEKLLLSKQRWTAERYFRRLASCYAIYAEISRQIIQ